MTYKIEIETLDKGYLVKVGCKKLAFKKRKDMLRELERYLKNPKKVEEEYFGTVSRTVMGWGVDVDRRSAGRYATELRLRAQEGED